MTDCGRAREFDLFRCAANYMIVLLHAWGAACQYCDQSSFESMTCAFFADKCCNVALAALFLISGHLLFRNYYDMSAWTRKMGNRMRRLFVPYVCWNLVFVSFYLAVGRLFPRVGQRVSGFGLDTFTGAVSKILHPFVQPIDVPLWFVRTIFVFALVSPVMWVALRRKRGRWIGLWAVTAYFLATDLFRLLPGVPGYSGTALFLFYLGGLLMVCGRTIRDVFESRWWIVPGVVGLGLDLCDILGLGSPVAISVRNVLKMPLFFWLAGKAFVRWEGTFSGRWFGWVNRSAFFVYAGHFLFCSVWIHTLGSSLSFLTQGKAVALVVLFCVPGLATTFFAYWLGRRFLPRLLRFFDGSL